jgi:hypothetical protein
LYECETWTLALREERKVFENRVLSGMFENRVLSGMFENMVLSGMFENMVLSGMFENRVLSGMFENRVLSGIFGSNRVEVTGEWRKLHNGGLHDLYCSPSIVRVIKSRRM